MTQIWSNAASLYTLSTQYPCLPVCVFREGETHEVNSRRRKWNVDVVIDRLSMSLQCRGLPRDVVYLDWPIAPSYMSPYAEGGLQGLSTAVYRILNKLCRSNSKYNLYCSGREVWGATPPPPPSTPNLLSWLMFKCLMTTSTFLSCWVIYSMVKLYLGEQTRRYSKSAAYRQECTSRYVHCTVGPICLCQQKIQKL